MKLIQRWDGLEGTLKTYIQRLVDTLADVENWHEVGETGEPAFNSTWANLDSTRKARFYKDPYGVIHLGGIVVPGASGTFGTTGTAVIFVLPEGYRPGYTASGARDLIFSSVSNLLHGVVFVDFAGNVIARSGATDICLDGISFRAKL